MSAYSESRTFFGDKMFSFFNTFSCLGILYNVHSFSPDDDHRKRQELSKKNLRT